MLSVHFTHGIEFVSARTDGLSVCPLPSPFPFKIGPVAELPDKCLVVVPFS